MPKTAPTFSTPLRRASAAPSSATRPLVAALKRRLKPVLALHGRDGALEIIVYDDDVPESLSVPGAFLAFSTGLLDLARSDGELQGVAARELAREYFTLPSARQD